MLKGIPVTSIYAGHCQCNINTISHLLSTIAVILPDMGKKQPLLKGVTIESVGAEGQGITHHEGKVVFVEGGIPGDVADVRVYKSKKAFSMGRYETILKESPLRVQPFCHHFTDCGGCKWQHLAYDSQLMYKQQMVADQLQRIGHVDIGEMEPILGAPSNKQYRNKLEFTFSSRRWLTQAEINSGDEVAYREGLGFHISGAYDKVLDITECWLMHPLQDAIRNSVREHALQQGYSFYDIRAQQGFLRNLIVRNTISGEWMVVLVHGQQNADAINGITDMLVSKFPEIRSVYTVYNNKRNDTILDLGPTLQYGDAYLIETLGDKRYRIGPKSFFQTNSVQAKHLYDKVVAYAGLQPSDNVYDLYTGAGSIALYVADKCRQVTGIEMIPEAVADAGANMSLNGVSNASFWAGDIRQVLSAQFITDHGAPDVVITDPPRAGMHPDVVEVLRRCGARTIVYVSCNPATQARDIQMLSDRYRVEKVQPVDMFPHTHHVESVALLRQI